ncbi:hypothetical protein BJ322DRAFT_1018005 [Thelephora terrestris]|uniref:Uncharacterized protein n=1 Tax=Thelephora terrestris TaxID=56493 RepID=A0A9P6HKU3_9AGAM|nr:hypothetical protein BJ322DRAFT_1018005 [Thelephora terrestris]
MTFAWAYFHATEHWRTTWTGRSAAAKSLSRHFKSILHAIERPADHGPAPQIPALFSRGCNAFRDVLSEQNPVMFKRHGEVDACLADILHSLSHDDLPSRYSLYSPLAVAETARSSVWASITHSENAPHYESLQEWVTRWFDQKASSLQRVCAGCGAECLLTRSFLQPPWIWFEIFVEQPHVVTPALELVFWSHTYRLAAVIYGNGRHFVSRLSTSSGVWWNYDGQANGGRPKAIAPICTGFNVLGLTQGFWGVVSVICAVASRGNSGKTKAGCRSPYDRPPQHSISLTHTLTSQNVNGSLHRFTTVTTTELPAFSTNPRSLNSMSSGPPAIRDSSTHRCISDLF